MSTMIFLCAFMTHQHRQVKLADQSLAAQPISNCRLSFTLMAGTPAYTVQASRLRVATDPSPSTAPSPRFTPGATDARAHTHAYAPIFIAYAIRGNAGSS